MRTSFFPFTEPSVEFDVTCFICDAKGCPVCKHSGWIEMGGAGWVDPQVFATSATTPTSGRASRSASGSSASRCSATACPTCACSGRTTSASWSSSSMKVPVSLAARVRRVRPAGRGARAAARLHELRGRPHRPRGVPDEDGNLGRFLVGQGARGREASERGPAPALPGRRGGGRAAPDRVRRLELRRRRDGRRGAAGRDARRAGSSSSSARCAASSRTG